MESIGNKIRNKNTKLISCVLCDFHTVRKSEFNRHLSTRKHNYNVEIREKETLETESHKKTPIEVEQLCNNEIAIVIDNDKNYCCDKCNKKFMVRSGLWKHKKKCKNQDKPVEKPDEQNLMLKIVEQQNNIFTKISDVLSEGNIINKEGNKINKENSEKLIELVQQRPLTITNNNTNNNNKTFNLNLFLNEDCKNALNITDFINNIQIEFDDLENVGKLGYVDGISNIIIKSLKNMDVKERPIHCTDLKRETLYIKDEDLWNKENEEKEKLRKLIDRVANKNLRTLPRWCDLHPESEDLDSREYKVFHNIYKNSLGGEGNDEQNKFNEKIIKNISKNVLVEKP